MISKNHLVYYGVLITVLLCGIVLIFLSVPNKALQMAIVVLIGFLYVLTGVVHHRIIHDLVPKIVVEYILIAAVGIAAAFFIFKGGFGI